MALNRYTSEELLETIRTRGMLSDHGQLGTDDTSLLRFANEEMMNELVPAVMRAKEEYFVVSRRYPLVASTNRYRIPPRALGLKLRQVHWVDETEQRIELERFTVDDLEDWDTSSGQGADPRAYYIENNQLVLLPNVESSPEGSLELSFYLQPGQLVPAAETRTISAITGGSITLSSAIPATFTSTALYDIHSPESGAEVKAFDLAPTTVSGSNITFPTASVNGSVHGSQAASVGDYVVLAGEAAIPGLPRELHPILAQAVVVRTWEALGGVEHAQLHRASLNRMLVSAGMLIENRVDGKPLKVLARNAWVLYGGVSRF